MDQWIASLVTLVGSSAGVLARATAERLMSVWKTITGIFGRVRAAWDLLYGRARRWALAQARHALATLNALRWTVSVLIPYKLATLADSIAAWVRERIVQVVTAVSAQLARLEAWVERAVKAAVGELRQVRDWLVARIADVAALARTAAERVSDLLDSPDRLVTWILGPLTRALWEWVWREAARLGELAWRYRQQITARALAVVEDVLARII